MPEVQVNYPRGRFSSEQKRQFMTVLRQKVADEMEAKHPVDGTTTDFHTDPAPFIDVLMKPYDPDEAMLTTVCLARIITYGWEDRLGEDPESLETGMKGRLQRITDAVLPLIPRTDEDGGMDSISFTFIGKGQGCWYAAGAESAAA